MNQAPQQIGSQCLQTVLIARGLGGEAAELRGHFTGKNTVQQRQHFMAQAIASGHRLGVAGVLTKSQLLPGNEGINLGAAPVQQRSVQLQGDASNAQAAFDAHGPGAAQAAAAAEIGQQGLGLVVGVMPKINLPRAMPPRATRQKLMTQLPCRCLQRELVPPCEGRHIGGLQLQGQAKLFGHAAHELRVAAAGTPAQSVIEMADHQWA